MYQIRGDEFETKAKAMEMEDLGLHSGSIKEQRKGSL